MRSRHSWSCEHFSMKLPWYVDGWESLTFALPKFSIAGILWPEARLFVSTSSPDHVVVSILLGCVVPRRSSSRSPSGLLYDSDPLISSAVRRMM